MGSLNSRISCDQGAESFCVTLVPVSLDTWPVKQLPLGGGFLSWAELYPPPTNSYVELLTLAPEDVTVFDYIWVFTEVVRVGPDPVGLVSL